MKPLWEGAISFGLILIPVKMYKASEDRKPDFHLVREEDSCPVKYLRVCKYTGEEIPYDKIAKSYEPEKGEQIIFNDDDFRKAFKKRTENIEIVEFVSIDEIDSKYFQQPYYLEPAKGASKVYALLREALGRSGKAGIAKYVIHNLEHLGVLKTENDVLVLNQIRYFSELRQSRDLKIPSGENLEEREVNTAIMLISQLTSFFKPEEFKDTYSEEIKKAIEEKKITGRIVPKETETGAQDGETVDLMEKLKKSLEMAGRKNVS
jgi:DNA end-binding protein Ku